VTARHKAAELQLPTNAAARRTTGGRPGSPSQLRGQKRPRRPTRATSCGSRGRPDVLIRLKPRTELPLATSRAVPGELGQLVRVRLVDGVAPPPIGAIVSLPAALLAAHAMSLRQSGGASRRLNVTRLRDPWSAPASTRTSSARYLRAEIERLGGQLLPIEIVRRALSPYGRTAALRPLGGLVVRGGLYDAPTAELCFGVNTSFPRRVVACRTSNS
jgi:hypothetical protein